jgi:hypothetical protein
MEGRTTMPDKEGLIPTGLYFNTRVVWMQELAKDDKGRLADCKHNMEECTWNVTLK